MTFTGRKWRSKGFWDGLSPTGPPGGVAPSCCHFHQFIFRFFLLVIWRTGLERTPCFSAAPEGTEQKPRKRTTFSSSRRSGSEVRRKRDIPVPQTGSELVDVGQKGQKSPSVSITAAKGGGSPCHTPTASRRPGSEATLRCLRDPWKPQGQTAGCDTVSMIPTHSIMSRSE